MPTFSYKARRKRGGESVDGTIEARDRSVALMELQRQGLVPLSVEEGRVKKAGHKHAHVKGAAGKRFQFQSSRKHMRGSEVLLFSSELSDLLASGMTLATALNSLSRRRAGRVEGEIISAVRDEIVRGASFSDALSKHPRTFTELYVNMIRAGEAGGGLDEVLRRLVEHYERMQELKEKVVMALAYPAIIVVLGVGVMAFSMIKVIPQFQTVFESMGQQLPASTRLLIGMSTFAAKYGLFVLIGVLFLGVLLFRWLKTEKGCLVKDRFLLRTPLVRGICASATYANFAQTLGTLLRNGVPIVQALGIVGRVVGNVVIGKEIMKARDRVSDGTSISGPLAAGGLFPPMLIDMLAIGEQTGDMPSALDHVSRRLEKELDRNVKLFTTALEPILIVAVSVLVGFVAISILSAVFSMTNTIDV
jgi:type IV pilus assembly protein PilC